MQLGAKLQNSLLANRTSVMLRSVPLSHLISESESLILFRAGQTCRHAKRYEKFEGDLERYDKKIEALHFTPCRIIYTFDSEASYTSAASPSPVIALQICQTSCIR